MKKLELNQMEMIEGGAACLSCAQSIAMAGMMGSMLFGGIGGIVTMALAGLGSNCLDVGNTRWCHD